MSRRDRLTVAVGNATDAPMDLLALNHLMATGERTGGATCGDPLGGPAQSSGGGEDRHRAVGLRGANGIAGREGIAPATVAVWFQPSPAPSYRRWEKSDHSRLFARAVRAAGLDPAKVTMYALRHSNIVRQILAGVPLRVVAVNHDTSVGMLERTYNRYIGDHADALARVALLDTTTTPGPH